MNGLHLSARMLSALAIKSLGSHLYTWSTQCLILPNSTILQIAISPVAHHEVSMSQLAAEDVGEDLSVAMGVEREAVV